MPYITFCSIQHSDIQQRASDPLRDRSPLPLNTNLYLACGGAPLSFSSADHHVVHDLRSVLTSSQVGQCNYMQPKAGSRDMSGGTCCCIRAPRGGAGAQPRPRSTQALKQRRGALPSRIPGEALGPRSRAQIPSTRRLHEHGPNGRIRAQLRRPLETSLITDAQWPPVPITHKTVFVVPVRQLIRASPISLCLTSLPSRAPEG